MNKKKGFRVEPKTWQFAVIFRASCAFFLAFDAAGLWRMLSFFWDCLFPVRRLTDSEMEAASIVFSENQLLFDKIRIHEYSPLCKFSGGRVFVAFRVIHFPDKSEPTDVLIHELAHVAQYEKIGARYAPEALAVQFQFGRAAYNFEFFGKLGAQRVLGVQFCDFNREAQAQLVQDYFLEKTTLNRPNRLAEMQQFIAEMRAGAW